jgi:hypothetical protein
LRLDRGAIKTDEHGEGEMTLTRDECNRTRFSPSDPGGHYESYFQRANHPQRPLAFWIRYTVFSPRRQPEAALGELWAIYFDGEAGRIYATKQVFPLAACSFSSKSLDVCIGPAILQDGVLQGQSASGGHALSWSLSYGEGLRPLLLLPESFYTGGFPKAKALVGTPNAVYQGKLIVDEQEVQVDGWQGSQNHNWGSRHTDDYLWGQVAGFDDAPQAFLELSTARLRLGPLWTPWMSLIVLRLGNEEFALNGLLQSVRASKSFENIVGQSLTWNVDSRISDLHISAEISAPLAGFVGLHYANPPGGEKICLNTKLARCRLCLERPGAPPLTLETAHRAAFEILTDDQDFGVPVLL